MKKNYFILAVFIIFTSSLFASDNSLIRHISADIIVNDKKSAGEFFIKWVQEKNGYFLKYSDKGVVLRLADYNDQEMNNLLEKHGEIINYSYNSDNPDEEISVIRGKLKARENILSDYYSLLNSADFKGTLALEKEISKVLSEIEKLKGRLKKLEHNKMYSLVEINFFSEEIYSENEKSSFDWINGIDFYLLMEGEVPVE